MSADIKRALEAIIMVADTPVQTDMLAQLTGMPAERVEAILVELGAEYASAERGFQLVRVAGGWRYQSHPDQAPYIEQFVLEGQSAKLSAAALETLAIVAYKQPISRAQIASIRGVDPDAVMRTLHGRAYIAPVGRDNGPGQAVMWGTTQLFLEKLGIATLDDLPPIATFVPDASIVETLEKTLRAAAEVEELASAGDSSESSDQSGE